MGGLLEINDRISAIISNSETNTEFQSLELQAMAEAEPKSKAVIAVAEIFRAATDREKLAIFKEICDLRIQSFAQRPLRRIGIKFAKE